MKPTLPTLAIALLLGAHGCGGGSGPGDEDADAASDPDAAPDVSGDPAVEPATDAAPEPATDPAGDPPVGVDLGPDASVVYLHHSTGGCIWNGGVPEWITDYNGSNATSYTIEEIAYPSSGGYGWQNYPYDYWNIWINHEGPDPYMGEDTLEILTARYDVIMFKHCYPVSHIAPDSGSPDVASSTKSIENYMLQYDALRDKMHAFPDNRFIVWTGAALVEASTSEAEGTRARQFFTWVKETWDVPGDNIFVWDFFELETEGGLYLLEEHAASASDSHPGDTFSATVAPFCARRIVDVIQGLGDVGSLTGE
jgi:hypothetical protein